MLNRLFFTSIIILFTTSYASDYSPEAFQTRLSKAEDNVSAAGICKEFLNHTDDIEFMRVIQDTWVSFDKDGTIEFYENKVKTEPQSAQNAYLLGRILPDSQLERKIELGHTAISNAPDWPYGYRLVTLTYAQGLFRKEADQATINQLKETIAQDRPIFERFATMPTEDALSLMILKEFQIYSQDYEGALKTMDSGRQQGARWASDMGYAELYAMKGDTDKVNRYVSSMVDELIATGRIMQADRNSTIKQYTYSAYREAGAYQQAIDYLKTSPGSDKDTEDQYNIACVYGLMNDIDRAFEHLFIAVKLGYDRYGFVSQDSDLTALKSDKRWELIVQEMKNNWDRGADKRKHEALALKIDQPAPEWKLLDSNGNEVSLTGLKGNVVVLDFWATWCGPCRIAMPMIDDFVRNNAGKNVKVFSVNVWENAPQKAAKYMKDNDYSMTLLFGNDNMAKQYGVEGIPTLCVIDRQGRIRYKESGVHEGLKENLIWWTEDLR